MKDITKPQGFWAEMGKGCCLVPLIIGLMVLCYVVYKLSTG